MRGRVCGFQGQNSGWEQDLQDSPAARHSRQEFLVVLYDNQTRSMLQTDARLPSIGSQKQGLVINPDTSVDVYFGPIPPAGHEANWAQTVPGKDWNVLFRL
ncbi:MAG TPA: DUF1214 domain-containing protein [Candidatus Limnocylindrales bacterium]|nr:DUF1214 domain-containing protein [Candidatus Limnocylindrales bacterium]